MSDRGSRGETADIPFSAPGHGEDIHGEIRVDREPSSRDRRRGPRALLRRALARVVGGLDNRVRSLYGRAFGYAAIRRPVTYTAVTAGASTARTYLVTHHAPRGIVDVAAKVRRGIGGFRILDGAPDLHVGHDLHYLPADNHRDAALYDPQGHAIRESISESVFDRHRPKLDRTVSLAAHDFVVETRPSIYLGYCFDQFGHFLTETMSRFWMIPEIDPREFNFVIHKRTPQPLRAFMLEVLDLFGIPSSNVIRYDRPVRFDSILVPAQAIRHKEAVWTRFLDVTARIGAAVDAPLRVDPDRAVYFSKERFGHDRTLRNESALVDGLGARGVQILYPETLPVRDRIVLYNHCRTVMGIRASAHHLNLFSARPLHHVYFSGPFDRRFVMLDAAKGNRSTWIHGESSPPQDGQTRWSLTLDVPRCLEVCDRLLS
jgi:hypothetical protein